MDRSQGKPVGVAVIKKVAYRQRTVWTALALAAATVLGLAAHGATKPANNLLLNGGFEKGLTKDGQPVGWHTQISGIIPIPQYTDPQKKKGRRGVVHFQCECGHDWGTVRPWVMLVCPRCERLYPGLEDSGNLYQSNHKYVDLADRPHAGKVIRFTLPEAVGNLHGVRVVSHLIKAERSAGYEISFDAAAEGSHLRVFVEGFQQMTDDDQSQAWVKTLPAKANPRRQTARLKRVFRKQVHVGTPVQWQHFSAQFVPPDRYAIDYMFVNLYAYMPGKAAYDRVVLRKLTAAEKRRLLRDETGAKGRRPRSASACRRAEQSGMSDLTVGVREFNPRNGTSFSDTLI